tara:strand:- start:105 stop:1439 length:1335 start_codon:yes stop_codon:yes gene_type:complete
MKITVIGVGYVGLVTGVCMADIGHDVVCLDINKTKIKNLKKGILPIYENGLQKIFDFNHKKKRIKFTDSYSMAINHADIIFIAVDTPAQKDGNADLSSIKNTCTSIASSMNTNKIIIEKSTVPVGTSDLIYKLIRKSLKKHNKSLDIAVVSNPEFLKEGSAVDDFMKPDRIIIGLDDKSLESVFNEMYLPFNRKYNKIQYMDIKSAELTKYAANAILATKISFINELANIADKLNVDIENIRKGIGADKRIGTEFLYPGCGYGGSCFPKDISALISTAVSLKYNPKILKSVQDVNQCQKLYLEKKVSSYFKGKLRSKVIAVWGLSFKPNTDDTRFAPSISTISSLLDKGAHIKAYDPIASLNQKFSSFKSRYTEFDDSLSALKNADALIIFTEWKEFWSIDLNNFLLHMRSPVIFDGRNIYSPKRMADNKILYFGVGRGSNKLS